MKKLIVIAVLCLWFPIYGYAVDTNVPIFPTYLKRQLPYVKPFIVTAKLNGYPIRLMFDSGADHTCISMAWAKRVNLKSDSKLYQENMAFADGHTAWQFVFVADSIEVQSIKGNKFKVAITYDDDADYDGLLGRDFLLGLGGVGMDSNGGIKFFTKEMIKGVK